jgi:hypothetical protein
MQHRAAALPASRWELARKILNHRWVSWALCLWAIIAAYDTALSQVIPASWGDRFPKVREMVAVTSGFLPFWVWLLILAALLVLASLEYAFRRSALSTDGAPTSLLKGSPRRMIALFGMVICGAGFFVFTGIYYWSPRPPQSPTLPILTETFPSPIPPAPAAVMQERKIVSSMSNVELKEYSRNLTAAISSYSDNFRKEESNLLIKKNNFSGTDEERQKAEGRFRDNMMQRSVAAKIEYNRRFSAKVMVLYDELLHRNGNFDPPIQGIPNMALIDPSSLGGLMNTVTSGINTLRKLTEQLSDF